MMTKKEFKAQAEEKWGRNGTHPFPGPFAEWMIDNIPQEQSTWEKILEQHAELCNLSGRGYLIKTKDDGTHALVWLSPRDGWVNDISYTTDDNFLKQLTAMVDDLQPVTRQQAGFAWGRLCLREDSEPVKTLNAFFAQKDED